MSVVERFLDDMFDRLAGTGGPGRRALAEAEDHLRAAVADAIAAGLPAEQAELHAVARFGPPRLIAKQLRWASAGGAASRALYSAWLLAGVAVAGLGAAYLAVAARTVASQWGHADCRVYLAQGCGYGFTVTRHIAAAGAVILVCAIGVLISRWLVIRRIRLAAGTWYTAAFSALWCAAAGAVSYAATAPPGTAGPVSIWQLAGLNIPLIVGGVAVTAALAAASWTLAHTRRGYPR